MTALPSRAPHQPPSHARPPPYVFKEYEVKCPETFAWYQGYIKGLVTEPNGTKKLRVSFPDDWKEEQIVNLEDIRPASDPDAAKTWQARLHEDCEAQAKSAPNEPYGWWGCKIQSAKEGLYLINFSGWGDIHNEILGPDMLRPANTNPPLKSQAAHLHQERVEIPKELHSYAKQNTGELVGFVNRLPNIFHFGFDAESGHAVIIGSKESLKRAKQLLVLQIDNTRDIFNLEQQAQKKQAQLEEKAKRFKDAYVEKWTIENKDLIKYVFGRQGKNIKEAKKIPGIIDIQVNDSQKENAPATVSIFAELGKEQAAKEARDILEIVLRTFPVPSSCMGAIIGQRGQTINDITTQSEVIRIRSWDKWLVERSRESNNSSPAPTDPEQFADRSVPDPDWGNLNHDSLEYFVIIGKKSCVLTARLMIEQKAMHKLKRETVLANGREIDREMEKFDPRGPRSRRGGGGGYRGARGGRRGGGMGQNGSSGRNQQRRGVDQQQREKGVRQQQRPSDQNNGAGNNQVPGGGRNQNRRGKGNTPMTNGSSRRNRSGRRRGAKGAAGAQQDSNGASAAAGNTGNENNSGDRNVNGNSKAATSSNNAAKAAKQNEE